MEKSLSNNIKLALLFAISFFLFAVVKKIWQSDSVSPFIQILAIAAYGLFLFWIFNRKQLVTFAGFSILLLGHNYIWQDTSVEIYWKIAATILLMLQIGTLGVEDEKKVQVKSDSRSSPSSNG